MTTYLAKLFCMRLDLSENIFHICNHVCKIYIQYKLVRSYADFPAKMKKNPPFRSMCVFFYDHIFIYAPIEKFCCCSSNVMKKCDFFQFMNCS